MNTITINVTEIQGSNNHYDYDKARPMKDIPRDKALNLIQGVAKRVFLLPALNCIDIKRLLELGKADKKTHFVLLERDPAVAKVIANTCKKLGLKNVTLIVEDFASMLPETEKMLHDLEFDLVFLDFCGAYTPKIGEPIKRIWGNNKNTTDFAVTLVGRKRVNPFQDKHPGVRPGFKYPKDPRNFMQIPESNLKTAKWGCDRIMRALGVKSDALGFFIHYKDGVKATPMVCFSLDTSKVARETKYDSTTNTNKPKERTEASKRAWETRRKNASKRNLKSEVAKRAWETRRANAAK